MKIFKRVSTVRLCANFFLRHICKRQERVSTVRLCASFFNWSNRDKDVYQSHRYDKSQALEIIVLTNNNRTKSQDCILFIVFEVADNQDNGSRKTRLLSAPQIFRNLSNNDIWISARRIDTEPHLDLPCGASWHSQSSLCSEHPSS